jgi:hypothetical protein
MTERSYGYGMDIAKSSERASMTPDERHAALQDRIATSRRRAVLRKTFLRDNLYDRKEKYYHATKVRDRQLPKVDAEAVSHWAQTATVGTVLQCPEFQEAYREKRQNEKEPYLRKHDAIMRDISFERGNMEWIFNARENAFYLRCSTDDVDQALDFNGYGHQQLTYWRREDIGQRVAFLAEVNTHEAFAGAEAMIRLLRESGSLRPFPEEYVRANEVLWEKIRESTIAWKSGIALVGTSAAMISNPSLQTAAALGVTAALGAYGTRRDIRKHDDAVLKDIKSKVHNAEFVWEYPPKNI